MHACHPLRASVYQHVRMLMCVCVCMRAWQMLQEGLIRSAQMFHTLDHMVTVKVAYTLIFAAAMVLLLVSSGRMCCPVCPGDPAIPDRLSTSQLHEGREGQPGAPALV